MTPHRAPSPKLSFVLPALCLAMTAATAPRAAEFSLANDLQPHLAQLAPVFGGDPASRPLAIERPDDLHFSAHHVIRMKGPIEPGDAARFTTLYDKLYKDTGITPYVLVMDSPGGNFLAGIELGEALGTEAYIDALRLKAVVVLEGERCLSACALAFALAGSNLNDEPRMIESGGLVGFHMGVLPEKTQRSQAEVGQIMDLTYDIMQSYLGLLRDERNPLVLLLEAVRHRDAASFFLLGAEPRAADLGFVPMARGQAAAPVSAAALDLDTLGSMCNSMAWTLPGLVDEIGYDHWNNPAYWGEGGGLRMTLKDALAGPDAVIMSDAGNFARCYASIGPSGELRAVVRHSDAPDYDSMPKPGERIEGGWFQAGANTPAQEDLPVVANAVLADTLGCPGGTLATRWSSWMDDIHPEKPAEFRPFPPDLPLKRAVTLRADAGLEGKVLAEVPAGTPLTVKDCQLVDDSQAVWYQIDHQGQTGWISARFASIFTYDFDSRAVHAHDQP